MLVQQGEERGLSPLLANLLRLLLLLPQDAKSSTRLLSALESFTTTILLWYVTPPLSLGDMDYIDFRFSFFFFVIGCFLAFWNNRLDSDATYAASRVSDEEYMNLYRKKAPLPDEEKRNATLAKVEALLPHLLNGYQPVRTTVFLEHILEFRKYLIKSQPSPRRSGKGKGKAPESVSFSFEFFQIRLLQIISRDIYIMPCRNLPAQARHHDQEQGEASGNQREASSDSISPETASSSAEKSSPIGDAPAAPIPLSKPPPPPPPPPNRRSTGASLPSPSSLFACSQRSNHLCL
jgi:hypothetical protein